MGAMDEASVQSALAKSFLSGVPPRTRQELLRTSSLISRSPGGFVISGQQGFAGIVISGLLRVYVEVDGQIETLRNVAIGEAVGIGTLLGVRDDVWVQAVSASRILSLSLPMITMLHRDDPAFNLAAGREALRRARDTRRELILRRNGHVAERVARYILDLAAEHGSGDPVNVTITQQEIADAVGAGREPVNRAMGDARRLGAVCLGRARITISDPEKLRSIAMRR